MIKTSDVQEVLRDLGVRSTLPMAQPPSAPALSARKRVRFETFSAPNILSSSAPRQATKQPSAERTFAERREDQAVLLSVGGTVDKSVRGQWPVASATTAALFKNRHAAHTTYSGGYMRTQERFLFLLDEPPDKRFERFEKECYLRALAPTTAHAYWVSFVSVDKIVSGQSTTPAEKRVSKILENRANRYPVAFPRPLEHEVRRRFTERYRQDFPVIAALVEACWVLGQRYGDFLQLAANDFTIEGSEVKITMRRGKTVSYTKPYTLTMDKTLDVTRNLLAVRQKAIDKGWLFLISKHPCDETAKNVSHQTSNLLAALDERLEIRSIRRGGLQHMASQKVPIHTIRLLSQHKSDEMLLRYLDWGRVAAQRNDEVKSVTSLMASFC
ncbi:MAG: phage integrase family protein [bacterium]|nr:phage integrase family protein [bacterium]